MRASAAGEGLRRAGHDRPVDQREERKLVAGDVEPDRLAGFERGALREEQGQALQAGLADAVDLGVAGDDVGEPRLDRGLHGEVEIGRHARRGRRDALRRRIGTPLLRRCPARRPASRTSARRSRPRARAPPPRAAGACAGSGRSRRRAEHHQRVEREQRERRQQHRPAQVLRLAEPIGLEPCARAARNPIATSRSAGASVLTASSPSGGP